MHIKTSNQESFNIGFGGYTCNWGAHICGLYETESEHEDILFGLLKQGCLEGDLLLYCLYNQTQTEFIDKFSQACPECRESLEDPHQFKLPLTKDLYYPSGRFSPWAMDEGLNRFYAESQQDGYRHVRATAEMEWALQAIPGNELLMVYESRLNYFIPGKPWLSVCLYDVNKFSGAQIMNVLRTHPFAINKGIITQNPYYMDPDRWLAENAPDYLPVKQ